MKVLVTGGVRSGKSRHAEQLVGDRDAVYVAAGPTPEDDPDPDWRARVAAHRLRRPASWTTYEGLDVARVLRPPDKPAPDVVLVDCLGTWLTGVVDDGRHGSGLLWDAPPEVIEDVVSRRLATVLEAIDGFAGDLVVVTNEVGLGVVPEHRSGRVFRDLLGTINQEVGGRCDEVHLVVAGRVLRL